MKKIKMLVVGLFAMATLAMGVTVPAMAVSCPTGTVRGDNGQSANSLAECNLEKEKDEDKLMNRVQVIINFALAVLGLVAVAIVIVGGVNYMTSMGDPAKITKAKNTIMYGIIGLVIALLAFAIVNFVLNGIFGNN